MNLLTPEAPSAVSAPPLDLRHDSGKPAWWPRLLALTALGLQLLLTTLSAVELGPTIDEPAHIATGLEWVDQGRYTYEEQHPPLGRIAVAVGPYLLGARTADTPDLWTEGDRVLYAGDDWRARLSAARFGTLVFLVVLNLAVWLWARRAGGELAGALATTALLGMPALLGHAALATIDLAAAAMILSVGLVGCLYVERPTLRGAALLGAAVAAALLTKLSALLLVPAILAAIVLWLLPLSRWRRLMTHAMVAGITACFLIWGGYRFSLGPLLDVRDAPFEGLDELLGGLPFLKAMVFDLLTTSWMPAREFLLGIRESLAHNSSGHRSFFLGAVTTEGSRWFFPVAVLLKTPLPVLALALAGSVHAGIRLRTSGLGTARWALAPVVSLVATLAALSVVNLNIGLRHGLVVFPLFAIIIGTSVAFLLEQRPAPLAVRVMVATGLLSLSAFTVSSFPNSFAYFNALVRNRPENYLVFTDLAWGQDLAGTAERLRAEGGSSIALATVSNGVPDQLHALGFPAVRYLEPFQPDTGWIAVDWYALRVGSNSDLRVPPDAFRWLERYDPVARVGQSMLLYHFDRPAELTSAEQEQRELWRARTEGGDFTDPLEYSQLVRRMRRTY